jgi:hypothetical protein
MNVAPQRFGNRRIGHYGLKQNHVEAPKKVCIAHK